MKKLLILLIFSHLGFGQQAWKPLLANVTFKIKHVAGVNATGLLKGFVGSVNFDKQNLSTASIKASIDAATIETGNGVRDKVIKGDDYFDVQKYPKITMVSTKIEAGKNLNEYVGTFNLTIKNVTKTISFPFSFVEEANKGVFKGSFSLNRTEYGVGGKSFILSDTPTISITLNVERWTLILKVILGFGFRVSDIGKFWLWVPLFKTNPKTIFTCV